MVSFIQWKRDMPSHEGENGWEKFERVFTDRYILGIGEPEVPVVGSVGETSESCVSEIAGSILVEGHIPRVLIDTGSAHSYIDEAFARARGMAIEEQGRGYKITHADGSTSVADQVCKGCQMVVGNLRTVSELTVSKLKLTEVLLGMD